MISSNETQSAGDEKEYFINFQFSNQELATIANNLNIEYEKIPNSTLSFKFDLAG